MKMNLNDLRMSLAKSLVSLTKVIGGSNEIDKEIDKTLDKIETMTPDQYKSVIETVKELQLRAKMGTLDRNIYTELDKLIEMNSGGITVSKDRINRYNVYDSIIYNIPFVKKALWIITTNILAPDDITKNTIVYEPNKESLESHEQYKVTVETYKNITENLQIDKKLEDIIMDTLTYGDAFVEIKVVDEKLQRLLTKYQVPFSEHKTININLYTYEDESNSYISKFMKVLNEDVNIVLKTPNKEPVELNQVDLILHDPRKIVKLQTKDGMFGYVYVETSVTNPNITKFGVTQINNSSLFNGGKSGEEFNLSQIVSTLSTEILKVLKSHTSITIDNVELKRQIANILSMDRKLNYDQINIRYIPENRMVHFYISNKRFFPYGESWLYGTELDSRLYLTDKVATVVHRIARSGDRQVVYVETGVDPRVSDQIEKVKRQLIKKEVAWNETDINSIPSVVTPFERIYIPRRRGQSFVEFDSLNMGPPMPERMETNTELKKSLVNALSVPPSYLGINEEAASEKTLTEQSMLFARLIIGLQKKISEPLTELYQKIYQLCYSKTEEYNIYYKDIKVTFMAPQSLLLQSLNDIYNSVSNIANTLSDFGVPKKLIAKKFITSLNWDEIELSKASENENNEEANF